MRECVFCKIIRKEVEASMIYEDADVVAFLDINPLAEGHTLIVPKMHFVDIFDVDPLILERLGVLSKSIAQRMRDILGVNGVYLFNSSGFSTERSYQHFHMHVIPRKGKDDLKLSEWWSSKVREKNKRELANLANRLRI